MGISSLCSSSSRSLSAISYAMSKVSQESPPIMKARYSKGSPFQKVHPVVAKKFGDRTARLFSALEYWFSVMKTGTIFKFMEPCDNKHYRKGDSWSEELKLNRKAIFRASTKIITSYGSKAAYFSSLKSFGAHGVFCGMPYLSYRDRHTHQTFYLRNESIVADILSGNFVKSDIQISKDDLCSMGHVPYGKGQVNVPYRMGQYVPHVRDDMSHTVAPEPAVYQPIQTPTKNTTKNIYLSLSLSEENGVQEQPKKEREIKNVFMEQPEQPEHVEQPIRNIMENEAPDEDQSIGIVSQMIDIWVKITGKDVNRTHGEGVTERLKLAYAQAFESSIAKWEEYCKLLLTSKFLMGEIPSKLTGKGYELNLTHACKLVEIEKVISGGYTMGDRSKALSSRTETFLENSKMELAVEEEEIRNSVGESDLVKEFRLQWLNKFGATNYRDDLKDCRIEIGKESILVLHPSTRYKAKSISSCLAPAIFSSKSFKRINIFHHEWLKEEELIFDQWFDAG